MTRTFVGIVTTEEPFQSELIGFMNDLGLEKIEEKGIRNNNNIFPILSESIIVFLAKPREDSDFFKKTTKLYVDNRLVVKLIDNETVKKIKLLFD